MLVKHILLDNQYIELEMIVSDEFAIEKRYGFVPRGKSGGLRNEREVC